MYLIGDSYLLKNSKTQISGSRGNARFDILFQVFINYVLIVILSQSDFQLFSSIGKTQSFFYLTQPPLFRWILFILYICMRTTVCQTWNDSIKAFLSHIYKLIACDAFIYIRFFFFFLEVNIYYYIIGLTSERLFKYL